jgi:hypothetical protein
MHAQKKPMTRSCFFFSRGASGPRVAKSDEGIQVDLIEELVTVGCAPGQKSLAEDLLEFGESRFEFAGSRVSQVNGDGGLDRDPEFPGSLLVAMAFRRGHGSDAERFLRMSRRGTGPPLEFPAINFVQIPKA